MPEIIEKVKASRQPKALKVLSDSTSSKTSAAGAVSMDKQLLPSAKGYYARKRAKASSLFLGKNGEFVIAYQPGKGVDVYIQEVAAATPFQLMEMERAGVQGSLLKDLSKRMEVSATRIFDILGVPKATAEKKAAAGELVTGRGGQAALGMVRLLGIAQAIVGNSTAEQARDFDFAKWLGKWIERPQASLGGRKPADLLDTPTGIDVVARLLGSIESGAYQ